MLRKVLFLAAGCAVGGFITALAAVLLVIEGYERDTNLAYTGSVWFSWALLLVGLVTMSVCGLWLTGAVIANNRRSRIVNGVA